MLRGDQHPPPPSGTPMNHQLPMVRTPRVPPTLRGRPTRLPLRRRCPLDVRERDAPQRHAQAHHPKRGTPDHITDARTQPAGHSKHERQTRCSYRHIPPRIHRSTLLSVAHPRPVDDWILDVAPTPPAKEAGIALYQPPNGIGKLQTIRAAPKASDPRDPDARGTPQRTMPDPPPSGWHAGTPPDAPRLRQ